MKKIFILIAAIALAASMASAQKNKKDKEAAPPPSDADRFAWGSSKLIPKLKRIAITEITVNYKLTTTAKVVAQEKGGGKKIAGARVSAYLETTDGELTKQDFQTITDNFYKYFLRKLKEGGIDTVGFAQIKAQPFYDKISENDDDDKKKEKGGNEWVTTNANSGKIVHSGMTGFAGGKGMRSMDFVKDLDATAASIKLDVDFADVQLDMDIKSRPARDIGGGWYYPEQVTKTYNWGVNPEMRVGDPDNQNSRSLYWAAKGIEYLYQSGDVAFPEKYADNSSEDLSKARSGLAKGFAFRKELTPVLIQTTKEKYKAAAAKALERWADGYVAKCIQLRKAS
ncbi:hypothetical protein BH09BAC3_BH09BAC3_19020 [soil metagenome]